MSLIFTECIKLFTQSNSYLLYISAIALNPIFTHFYAIQVNKHTILLQSTTVFSTDKINWLKYIANIIQLYLILEQILVTNMDIHDEFNEFDIPYSTKCPCAKSLILVFIATTYTMYQYLLRKSSHFPFVIPKSTSLISHFFQHPGYLFDRIRYIYIYVA